jgi:flagellar hook protein FlgE
MSFTQGLSGLNVASSDLEVIGNNVANANTVGFKGSQAQFADVFAASLGGSGTSQIGIGARVATVAQQFTQGNISVTNNTLDMAVNGPGFFVLNGVNGIGYSRNGQFQLDKDGYIVTSTGKNLTGWPASTSGVVATSGPTSNLQISTASILPIQTTTVTATLNLDSRMLPPSVAFDPTNTASFNSSTSTSTYDSKGNAQINTMYFVKAPVVAASGPTAAGVTSGSTTVTVASTAGLSVGQAITGADIPAGAVITSITNGTTFEISQSATGTNAAEALSFGALTGNAWNVYVTVSDPAAPVTTPATYLSPNPAPVFPAPWTAAGTLVFNTNGTYSATASTTPTTPTYTPAGASAQTISYDFTSATQFGSSFGVTKLVQDGNTSGALAGFSTAADGTIVGRYTNGMQRALGQVALATFPNNQGLQPLGDNVWASTTASGAPVIGVPGAGNNGVLQTSATEDSNVDLTAELVKMITAQRMYQANAQTIKTQDSIMQTIVNLR